MRRKVLGAMAAIILTVAGCGGGNEKKAGEAMGPEETVEAFCRAVARGDFAAAMTLCDTTAMSPYIRKYAEAWDMLAKKDSGATAIAGAILSEAEFVFEKTVKDGDSRTMTYTIGKDGMTKRKTATVKKEEGVWKVERITDRT